jgi:large subunit ribosomal protein L5
MLPRIKQQYNETIVPELMTRFGLTNRLACPGLEKIVVNMGVGRAVDDKKILDEAVKELAGITGQRPVVCLAKKSVAGFRLREGVPIGCKVTLRGARMWEFFDRLANIVLPRIRDFRGLSPSAFDGFANYTLGIAEHSVFPEVNLDDVQYIFGMNVTICTTGKTDEMARELLRLLGLPLREA